MYSLVSVLQEIVK